MDTIVVSRKYDTFTVYSADNGGKLSDDYQKETIENDARDYINSLVPDALSVSVSFHNAAYSKLYDGDIRSFLRESMRLGLNIFL